LKPEKTERKTDGERERERERNSEVRTNIIGVSGKKNHNRSGR